MMGPTQRSGLHWEPCPAKGNARKALPVVDTRHTAAKETRSCSSWPPSEGTELDDVCSFQELRESRWRKAPRRSWLGLGSGEQASGGSDGGAGAVPPARSDSRKGIADKAKQHRKPEFE